MQRIVKLLHHAPVKMPGARINPLKLLRRTDKWYLGGGNRLIWTPPFPSWLDRPGFWDKAHYFNFELEPVFTWTLLDEGGNEIPLKAGSRSWDPSALVVRYSAGVILVRRLKTRQK